MEKSVRVLSVLMSMIACVFLACGGGGGSTGLSAGDQESFTADGVTFKLVYVPGNTFPTGTNDLGGPVTVSNAFWIGETEVTYELWQKVYAWATHTDRGVNIYNFANIGVQGDGTGDTDQHPVTTINWRDAMVWCNAATEWYNAKNGTSYTCVYTYSSAIIRDSRDSNDTACDEAEASSSATGFRLLTSDEWELAARYINDANGNDTLDAGEYYPGNHASGDTTSYCYPADGGVSIVFGNYAWYFDNCGTTTHAVKDITANALGLYAMSGNVSEWCFNWYTVGFNRVCRGGSWGASDIMLQVGYVANGNQDEEIPYRGFRFARSAP